MTSRSCITPKGGGSTGPSNRLFLVVVGMLLILFGNMSMDRKLQYGNLPIIGLFHQIVKNSHHFQKSDCLRHPKNQSRMSEGPSLTNDRRWTSSDGTTLQMQD